MFIRYGKTPRKSSSVTKNGTKDYFSALPTVKALTASDIKRGSKTKSRKTTGASKIREQARNANV